MNDTNGESVNLRLFNRDLSWLSFNERILKEAGNKQVPLLERINFLAIFSSNLDEFYRVRMPVLSALKKIKNEERHSDYVPNETNIYKKAKLQIEKQLALFGNTLVEDIIPDLKDEGILVVYDGIIPETIASQTRDYFYESIASF